MNDIYENDKQEYIKIMPLYEAFSRSLKSLIINLLDTSDINYDHIEARAKSIDSFYNKITRDDKNYTNALEEVTDLSGLRIVAYHQDDANRICELIRREFDIDDDNSVDKSKSLQPDQFGYRSVHYIVTFNSTRKKLKEYSKFKKFKAEIQVRTVLQHAWAAIDHKLKYKTTEQIPSETKRELFRISALLETADIEFSRTIESINKLKDKYSDQIKKNSLDLEINSDTLSIYLQREDVNQRILELPVNRIHLQDERQIPSGSFIKFLRNSEILTLKQLDTLFDKKAQIQTDLEKFVKKWEDGVKKEPNLKLVLSYLLLIRIIIFLDSSSQIQEFLLVKGRFSSKIKKLLQEIKDEKDCANKK